MPAPNPLAALPEQVMPFDPNQNEDQYVLDNQPYGMEDAVPTLPDMDHDDIVDYVIQCWQTDERDQAQLREAYDERWAAYTNAIDYSEKEDWQSKIRLPLMRSLVKKAVSLIRHILLKEKDKYITFEPISKKLGDIMALAAQQGRISPFGDDEETADLASILVRYTLDQAQFLPKLLEIIEGAFAMGDYWVKMGWQPDVIRRVESRPQPAVDPATGQQMMQWAPAVDPATGQPVADPWTGQPVLQQVPVVEWVLERVERQISSLTLEPVDPRHMFTDLDETHHIEETVLWLDEVVEETESGEEPAWNPEKVALLMEENAALGELEYERHYRVGRMAEPGVHRKRVHILEYWGDLFDKDGNLVERNCRIVIANQKYILNWPHPEWPSLNIQNPYFHEKPAYIRLSLQKLIGSQHGYGLIDPVLTIWHALNNLYNMDLDNLVMKLLRTYQIKLDWLEDPVDAEGWYPGQPILLNKDAQGSAIFEVAASDLPTGAKYSAELLHRAIETGAMVPEVLMGVMPGKGHPTATQVSYNNEEAGNYFETLAEDVENFIEEAGEICRQLLIQFGFGPDAHPDLERVFEARVADWAMMTAAERAQLLQSDMDIQASGISGYFRAQATRKQILDLLEIASKYEPLGAQLNHRQMAKSIILTAAMPNAEDMLVSKEEARAKEMAMMQRPRQPEPTQQNPAQQPQLPPGGQAQPGAQGIPPEILMQLLAQRGQLPMAA